MKTGIPDTLQTSQASQDNTDVHCYRLENILHQSEGKELINGRYAVSFYTTNDRLSAIPTETLSTFYYYPSAGALRDASNNIVAYSSKLDMYHKRRFGFSIKSD